MAQVGLKNFYYAAMTKDNSTDKENPGVEYFAPKRIVGLNSIDINPTVNDAVLYGDDAALATTSSLGEVEVTVDLAALELQDAAFLLGHNVVNGIMDSKAGDKAPYVAIMFESEKHDGKLRYVKLLKGRFTETQETINTKGDNVEYQIGQISGKFVAREFDGAWKRTYDQTGTDTTIADGWYTNVESSGTTTTDTTKVPLGQ